MEEREMIEITGAAENNLKNIRLRIPKERLVVLTGVSGSGKSSLAFDTIAEESRRRWQGDAATLPAEPYAASQAAQRGENSGPDPLCCR